MRFSGDKNLFKKDYIHFELRIKEWKNHKNNKENSTHLFGLLWD